MEQWKKKRRIRWIVIGLCILIVGVWGGKAADNKRKYDGLYRGDQGIYYPAKIEGKDLLIYDHGEWKRNFLKGVDMGVTKPGLFPGEYGITKEDYSRWFRQIGELNANTIRVYIAQKPEFYEALAEYNQTADQPIYLMQGIYADEDAIAKYRDVYANDGQIRKEFLTDIENIIDIVHGNATFEKKTGHVSGTYSADVSKYVVGWIMGIEWDPDFVVGTNQKNPEKNFFDGTYVYTENASPFEVFLAEAMERTIAYESEQYHEQRPSSVCNWVTTDPLSHPNEPDRDEDLVSVDVEHIKAKDTFEAGFFASYHIYPYYPELFNYDTQYLQDHPINTYRAYLKELNEYHTMPVLVAEVGIPSSRGITHENIHSGYNQGNIEETEQGEILTSLVDDIYEENYMGALVFSWQDEWFKRTWNTMDLDLADRRPYWYDVQTCEQCFGLLSFDPGEKESICYVDGDISEWKEDNLIIAENGYKLYGKGDEAYLYLMADLGNFDFDNQELLIPIDLIEGQGNQSYEGVQFARDADFLLKIAGKENSRLMVDAYYDVFYYQYAVQLGLIDRNPAYERKNTGIFNPIYLALNKELYLPQTKQTIPFSQFETGALRYGNGNPNASDYCSLADFYDKDGKVEIRIPWLMLNVMDPSSKKNMGDFYQNREIEAQEIRDLYIGLTVKGDGNTSPVAMGTFWWDKWKTRWRTWEKPTYHERLKKSYYILQEQFLKYH